MTIPKDWAWLETITGDIDDDFVAAVNEESPQQERPELEFFNEPAKPDGVGEAPGGLIVAPGSVALKDAARRCAVAVKDGDP